VTSFLLQAMIKPRARIIDDPIFETSRDVDVATMAAIEYAEILEEMLLIRRRCVIANGKFGGVEDTARGVVFEDLVGILTDLDADVRVTLDGIERRLSEHENQQEK
jgi:hypothetical protein